MKIENYTLENSLGHLLNKLSLNIKQKLEEKLKDKNITVHQFGILLLISKRTTLTQKEIAMQTNGDEPATARLMNRLEEKGYIERISDPQDKRKKLVSLTTEGKRLSEILLPHANAINAQFSAVLSPEEKETLLTLLNKLATVT